MKAWLPKLYKILPWSLAVTGSVAVLYLITKQGWSDVFGLLGIAGWALFWIVPLHVIPLSLDAISWRLLVAPRDPHTRAGLGCLLWVTAVRQAVAQLLPLSSIGGEVVGVRLMWLRGLGGAVATASVVMQLLVSLINQYLFAAVGVLLMFWLSADAHLGRLLLLGMILGLPLPLGVWIVLHRGRVFERGQAVVHWALGAQLRNVPALAGARVDEELQGLGRRPLRIMAALIVEFLGLITGAIEDWLVLRLIGHTVSPTVALALEAAVQATRHLFFMVPASLGVQEGCLLLFGSVFGLPTDMSIALSLAKRLREILLGVPALLSWQWVELRFMRQPKVGGVFERAPLLDQ